MFQQAYLHCTRQFLFTLLFAISSSVFANPSLLGDIATTPTPQSSDPRIFTEMNDVLYFAAATRQSGEELWATDGTDTWQVADIYPGNSSSYPSNLTVVDDVLYFTAQGTDAAGADVGRELWKYDATGLSLVDVYQGSTGSAPSNLTVVGNALYFLADGEDASGSYVGKELWKYDASGLNLIDVHPGRSSSRPDQLTAVGNALYFCTTSWDTTGAYAGKELWRHDVTGLRLIRVFPGSSSTAPSDLTAFGDALYFSARSTDTTGSDVGDELWKHDESGLSLVADIYPGFPSSGPRDLTVIDDALYFSAQGIDATGAGVGRELWKYNASGLTLIDVYPGSESSEPELFTAVGDTLYFRARGTDATGAYVGQELFKYDANGPSLAADLYTPGGRSSVPERLTAVGDALYFNASGPGVGRELWRLDVNGLRLVADLYSGVDGSDPGQLTVVGNALYFSTSGFDPYKNEYGGIKLFKHDASGLSLVDVNPGKIASFPSNLTVVGDALYFSARGIDATGASVGNELWKHDANGLSLFNIQNEAAHSDPREFVEVNGTTYFSANNSDHGRELWATDGIDTWQVADINPGSDSSDPEDLTAVGDALYFRAEGVNAAGADVGTELWKYDANGLSLIEVYSGSSSSYPRDLTVVDDALYFIAIGADAAGTFVGIELWRHDATGLSVIDVYPGIDSSRPKHLTAVGNALYFRAEGTDSTGAYIGLELWKHDSSGLSLVADINPGSGNSFPAYFTMVGDTLYFTAKKTDATLGWELWKYDASGLSQVADINPGSDGSFPSDLTTFGDALYFTARRTDMTGAYSGRDLWKHDDNGLSLVADIYPGIVGSSPRNLTVVDDVLYFGAGTKVGSELWKLDASSLSLLYVYPGSNSSYPSHLTAVGDVLYFRANDGVFGEEIWKTDGTAAGTEIAFDLVPGSGSSLPEQLTAIGNKLYFSADDGVFGQEPWVYTATANGTGRIGDYVWEDTNGDGIQDANESGLANVTVELWLNCDSSTTLSTITDSNGSFSFDNLPVGHYQLAFSKPAGYAFSPRYAGGNYGKDSNANPVDGLDACRALADGQSRNGLDAGLVPENTGTGRIGDYVWEDTNGDGVQDANESGLANVTVNLRMNCDSNTTLTTISDSNGAFSFDNLPVGNYQLEFIKPAGYAFSPRYAGGNYGKDSNANPTNGLDGCRSLGDGQNRNGLDAGFTPDNGGPVADTLTVINAIYFTADNRLWIRAGSDAMPKGSAVITASVVNNGVESVIGQVGWKPSKDAYQQLFRNVAQPDSIILNSNLGGTVSASIEVR